MTGFGGAGADRLTERERRDLMIMYISQVPEVVQVVNEARDGYWPRQRETSCPECSAVDDSRVKGWYCFNPDHFLLLGEGKGRLMGY